MAELLGMVAAGVGAVALAPVALSELQALVGTTPIHELKILK